MVVVLVVTEAQVCSSKYRWRRLRTSHLQLLVLHQNPEDFTTIMFNYIGLASYHSLLSTFFEIVNFFAQLVFCCVCGSVSSLVNSREAATVRILTRPWPSVHRLEFQCSGCQFQVGASVLVQVLAFFTLINRVNFTKISGIWSMFNDSFSSSCISSIASSSPFNQSEFSSTDWLDVRPLKSRLHNRLRILITTLIYSTSAMWQYYCVQD